LIIEGKVIVELRSVEMIHPVHKKQLLTSLRLTGMKLGYLLIFGSPLRKEESRALFTDGFDHSSVSPRLCEKPKRSNKAFGTDGEYAAG